MINSLLTAVTSPYCEVHEASLLLAVRACFHIHLVTRSSVNKQTAKAALTQILSAIFRRMELMEASTRARSGTGGHYALEVSIAGAGTRDTEPTAAVGTSDPYVPAAPSSHSAHSLSLSAAMRCHISKPCIPKSIPVWDFVVRWLFPLRSWTMRTRWALNPLRTTQRRVEK